MHYFVGLPAELRDVRNPSQWVSSGEAVVGTRGGGEKKKKSMRSSNGVNNRINEVVKSQWVARQGSTSFIRDQ